MTNARAQVDAVGDPMRGAILERLAQQPQAVGELAHNLPISRPAVSQHLKVLKDAGLVTDQKVGNRKIYRVDPEGMAALRAYFDQLWNQALQAYQTSTQNDNEHHEPRNDQEQEHQP